MAQTDNTRELTYNDVAWQGSWKQRAAGMWAAGAVGLVFGAMAGLVAPFFPVIAMAMPLSAALGMVGSSVATFAAAGIVAGAAAGGLVGLGSGGVAEVAKEQERRDQSRLKSMGIELPQPQKSTEPDPKSLFTRIKNYLNPRAGIIFTAMGMIAGGVFAAAAMPTILALAGGVTANAGITASIIGAKSAITAAAISGTGIATVVGAATNVTAAATAYCVGVMGCFGAIFGVRFAHLTNDLRNVMADMLSTKFGDEKKTQDAPQPQLQQAPEISAPTVDMQVTALPQHSAKHATLTTNGFQEMLVKQLNEAQPSTPMTR